MSIILVGQSEFWRFLTDAWCAGRGRQVSELEEDDVAKQAGDEKTDHGQNWSENLAAINRRPTERARQSHYQQHEPRTHQGKIDPRNITRRWKLNEEWITEKSRDNEEAPSPDR